MNPAVEVLGFLVDSNSSYLRGCAQGPPEIRKCLHSGASNWCAENGLDVEGVWRDLGDIAPAAGEAGAQQIATAVSQVMQRGAKVLALGGDHSISFPVLQAVSKQHSGLTVLHLDAHPDLYHDFGGNPYSHASPFARIMEAGLVRRLVQVGIRTLNPHQHQQAQRFGVEMVQAKDWQGVLPGLDGPLYISLDLDVLDPAFAPGVSHHEPGGFSVREVLGLLQPIQAQVVGADIVELNPARDPLQQTAAVAAKLFKELLAKMVEY